MPDHLRKIGQHAPVAIDRLRGLLAGADAPEPDRHVLRITQHPFPGDVPELTARGLEVDVVCPASPVSDDEVNNSATGLRIYRIPIRHRRGSAIRYVLEFAAFLVAAFGIASVLGVRRRYAAVHVDNLPDLLVFAGAVPRLRGARLVFTCTS